MRSDEKGNRQTLLVVMSSRLLVVHPNLCACIEIRPIEFRHMAERSALCACTLRTHSLVDSYADNRGLQR